MREIILDVETTGIAYTSPDRSIIDFTKHRITQFAAIELIDKIPTGNFCMFYVNPQMPVSEEAMNISGITNEFLKDKKLFSEYIDEMLEFLSNSNVIAHNASFDMGMINAELHRYGKNPLNNPVIDTLQIARKHFNTKNTLDALCARFKIDARKREKHDALIDCELLAGVYYHLCLKEQDNSVSIHSMVNDNIITIEENLIDNIPDYLLNYFMLN